MTRRAVVLLIAVLGAWHLVTSPRQQVPPPPEDPPAKDADVLRDGMLWALLPLLTFVAGVIALGEGFKALRIPEQGLETLGYCTGAGAAVLAATWKVTVWCCDR